jgi:hypothetical protein
MSAKSWLPFYDRVPKRKSKESDEEFEAGRGRMRCLLMALMCKTCKSSGLTVACGLSQSRRVRCDGARDGRR